MLSLLIALLFAPEAPESEELWRQQFVERWLNADPDAQWEMRRLVMDPESKPGTRVVYTAMNAWDRDRDRADAAFVQGRRYTVQDSKCFLFRWEVRFAEVPGVWDGSMFDRTPPEPRPMDWRFRECGN